MNLEKFHLDQIQNGRLLAIIKAPPYQGDAFSFCTVSSADAGGGWTPPLIHAMSP